METDDDDVEDDNPSDEDYIPSDECKVTEEELYIETDIQEVLHADVPYKERQFLVAESCLLELLSKCKHCGDNACVTLKSFVGTMIVVEVLCAKVHDYVWRSQVLSNSMPWGNLLLSSAILFSGSSPAKVINLFSHLNVAVFTTGHSAKFGSYTLMNLQDNKILHMELIQSNEVKNSFNMELEGLKRCLGYLQDCGMAITELVTDRHVQVKKFMSVRQADTHHSLMSGIWQKVLQRS